MKKILIFGVAFFTVFSLISCSNEKGADPVFKVNPDNLTFGVDAKEPQVIYVVSSSDVSWQAEVEVAAQEWLKITAETDKIIVSVAKNTTDAERTGKIIVKPDNKTFNIEEVTVSQTIVNTVNIIPTKSLLEFWGDYHDSGFSNYSFILGNGDTEYDEQKGDFVMNNGYYVFLDVLAEEIGPQDYRNIGLKEGTYKGSMDPADADFRYEKMSLITTRINEYPAALYCYSSIVVRYEGGKIVDRFIISDGEMTVKNDNGNYTISIDLTSPDGEKMKINYSGEFDAEINKASSSTYTNDLNFSGLNTGVLELYGNSKSYYPELYKWSIKIEIPGYDNVSELMIDLFSPTTSTTVLDDGSYKISDVYPYEPFIAEAGWSYSDIYGTWIIGYTGDKRTDLAPLIDGKVNVTHNDGDNYTIEVDAVMDNYYLCKASFKGDLEYVDMTVSQPAPSYGTLSGKKVSPKTRTKGMLVIDKSGLYK